MSAFSPVAYLEKSPDYHSSVPSVSTVTWPNAVPSAYKLSPWSSWRLHSKLNWSTVPSLGRYGVFSPPGSSLARSYEKPRQSYIGLIAEAIRCSPEKKLVLSDIYSYILTHYPYFRTKGSGWRNSIRHNLSLNDCFLKGGRSPNGKGHFWTICPMYYEDFLHGDYSRRRAGKVIKLDLKPTERFLSDSRQYFNFFSEEAKSRLPVQLQTMPPRYKERVRDEVQVTDVDCAKIDQCLPEHDPGQKRSFDVQSLLSLQH